MEMAIKSETIEFYRGYEIIKYTSSVGDVIYNAIYINTNPFYHITCASDNINDLKIKVDKQLQSKYNYKKIKYTINGKLHKRSKPR